MSSSRSTSLPGGQKTPSSSLFPWNDTNSNHGTEDDIMESQQHQQLQRLGEKAPLVVKPATTTTTTDNNTTTTNNASSNNENAKKKSTTTGNFAYYVVYALVNVIISVPGLYGYAAVIFNHPVFAPHMNALAKLVLFSSLMHQLGFLLFSSLDFAIGTVQDAGLIFLSTMANAIANRMLNEYHNDNNPVVGGTGDLDSGGRADDEVVAVTDDEELTKAIVSTTVVLLAAGTALLGLVLMVMGKFRLANAVSYLPMPVVGGYLAFIGYFCVQAGVALCISRSLVTLSDWSYLLWDNSAPQNLLLATPGLVAALLLTYVSRNATNDAILPITMVAIPAVFYVIIYTTGIGLEGARQGQWVGEVAPPVPVADLIGLVDFGLVRWDLISEIVWTWVGMVFVVSFASCLDVAAISIDMGEALDTNRELATVGICNLMSGLTLGFTGSYIFSQTIFTYRTGVHSRWIGALIMVVFFSVVVSPVNLLQIAPLFFLGSTLIFIGYDLLYEWLWEIRHSVLLPEYATIWGTFIAIQVAGVDAGILIGVLFAILEHVVATAQTTTVHRVSKRSRAVWSKEKYKTLHNHAYHATSPKIVTIELAGPVFFGSSLHVLQRLTQDVGLNAEESAAAQAIASPHTSSYLLKGEGRKISFFRDPGKPLVLSRPPQFCVLDLTQVSNLDASAARACFLQFSKICSKRGIVVVASGATPKIDWMLRSHGAAYDSADEEKVKAKFQRVDPATLAANPGALTERILLFLTTHEALEFCEGCLIHQFHPHGGGSGMSSASSPSNAPLWGPATEKQSISRVFADILESDEEETMVLKRFDGQRYHCEATLVAGQKVITKGSIPDTIYVVLKGSVASAHGRAQILYRHRQNIVSGAGVVLKRKGSKSDLLDEAFQNRHESPVIATLWPVGGVFGYSDLLLGRPHTFGAFATQDGTKVAKMTKSHLELLKDEDAALYALLNRVLLKASVLDLANCTCDDV